MTTNGVGLGFGRKLVLLRMRVFFGCVKFLTIFYPQMRLNFMFVSNFLSWLKLLETICC